MFIHKKSSNLRTKKHFQYSKLNSMVKTIKNENVEEKKNDEILVNNKKNKKNKVKKEDLILEEQNYDKQE